MTQSLLLPYCITDSAFTGRFPASGVRQAEVTSLNEGRLRCFYSSIEELTAISKEDVLAVHRLVSDIFQQTAVIPVRFPTLLASEEELRAFLRKQEAQYASALERLRDSVQMELLISLSTGLQQPKPESGKQYLQERLAVTQKLETAAELAHTRITHLVKDWRTRSGNQRDTLRCYALLERRQEKDFRDQIQSMTAPGGTKITCSGPWPCTEFLE